MINKLKEWIQLALMLYIIMLILGALISRVDPKSSLSASYNKLNCITPIYFYSGLKPYESSFCLNDSSGVLLARIYDETPKRHSANHIQDIIFFIMMIFGGFYSWFNFVRKEFRRYIPWL